MGKRLFFSHTWQTDELQRDTHQRVLSLARQLQGLGWKTWVDETSRDVHGFLDVALARAMENCDVVVVCLTKAYVTKIDAASSRHCLVHDNCLKEFVFARILRKPVLPVVMEPCMKDVGAWGMLAGMGLGGFVYADYTLSSEVHPVHILLCDMVGGGPKRGILRRRLVCQRRSSSSSLSSSSSSSPLSSSPSSSSSPSLLTVRLSL